MDDLDVLDIDQNNLVENNLYVYCLNNPVIHHDSLGKFAQLALAGGYLATGATVGSANFWNPVGWAVLGVTAAVAVGVGIHYGVKIYKEHRTTKNGSKKKTNDKHTKPRPGRQSEKKKQKSNWHPRNSK